MNNENIESMSLNDYVACKGTSVVELTNKYRSEIIKSKMYPINKAYNFITKECRELNKEGINELIKIVLDQIFEEESVPYAYLLYRIMDDSLSYYDLCKEEISNSYKKINDGIEIDFNKDWIKQQELELIDVTDIVDVLDVLIDENNSKNDKYLCISVLDKYISKNTCSNISYISFPEETKYERFYFSFPTELLENEKNCIHEEHKATSKVLNWIVVPENINITIRNKGCSDKIVVSARELENLMRFTFSDMNYLAGGYKNQK